MQKSATQCAEDLKRMELVRRYGTPKDFLQKYNPAYQLKICSNTDECLFGDYPTLGRLSFYGKSFGGTWLMAQLTELSEYCGCKEKMSANVIEQCAEIIVMSYGYLKVSEIMLFLFRFKHGDYGKFYGAIDPMVITCALRNFIYDRNLLIDKKEQQEREKRDAESYKNCISYAEYLRIKAEKKAGGTTASSVTKQA